MSFVKKLIFAPVFLILITTVSYFYQQILSKYLEVFFGSYGGLSEFALIAMPLVFASLCFALFVTFTQDFKYALILSIITALIPFLFLPTSLSLIIATGLIISLMVSYINLQINLRSYINFQPTVLLITPIKMLNTFLLITLAAGFYLHTNSIIQKEGFKIPDPLIDWAVSMSMSSAGMNFKGDKHSLIPRTLGNRQYLAQALTSEQIELLKQNPGVLNQYGLKPEDLDALVPATTPKKSSGSEPILQTIPLPSGNLKDVLKNQINSMIDQTLKPYMFVIPILLAFMFYSLASLIMWFISLFLSPLISLIFYVFEKTGFVKFEKEMREVKKIVI